MPDHDYTIQEYIEMQSRLTAQIMDEREKRHNERAVAVEKALSLAEKHAELSRKAMWAYIVGIVGMLTAVASIVVQLGKS